ncbi:HTH-type transcriptional regulator ArgP [Orrella marina]|uniref:ArgP/LysG family DNA-binding transcriptional regulator n=1 Tax=Orrella marina TaxID=2163011 RepID=A0A2R4XLE3_9BURK|nr:HTH-type transcriptional regulator ArgP [Orrella marina]AWB34603.1 ArgP/LysG family DNA-binding transcriptional regulator [Orrella marina]
MFDPKHIQTLLAVHREGSFQGAARVLNVTPAAVTLRVKALESDIGAMVLIRGKSLRLTPQGQAIVSYAQRAQLLEDELMRSLSLDQQTFHGAESWSSLRVAINTDSLATWFLPGVSADLQARNILLDIVVDDQDYTHEALASGEVVGCVTTLSRPMKGCVAEPLGVMTYRGLAHPAFLDRCRSTQGELSIHKLLSRPAIIFNRKDALHDQFIQTHLGLRQPSYPRYFVPALDAFERAIELGLGWGVVPQPVLRRNNEPVVRPHTMDQLAEIVPGARLDVSLYWQHWERESEPAQRLTRAVKSAARAYLRP